MIEPKSKAIVRAYNAIRAAKTEVALYWANNKVYASKPESSMHERRLKTHGENLIGVYSKGCDFELVVEDIEQFYKEIKPLPVVATPAPAFRSSGRRVKHDSL